MTVRTSLWTMQRCLDAFANSFEDREKVVFPDEDPTVRWDARTFDREVNRVARGYRSIGIEAGDRIGLIGLNTPDFVTAFYAATKMGAVPCNFNPREADERLAILGERFDPAVVVFDPRYTSKVSQIVRRVSPRAGIALRRDEGAAADPPISTVYSIEEVRNVSRDQASEGQGAPDATIRRDDTAFVNWSTGTTGVPKGLVWTNEGAVAAGVINARARGLTHRDVRINYGTPGFIGWFYATFPAIVAGAKLVFMEQFDPERYLELIERERVTEFGGVSTPIRMALDAGPAGYDLSSIESAYYVGETMNYETIERIRSEITPNVASLYGTTEATGLTALGSGNDDPTALSDHLPLVEARAVELRDGDESAPPDARVPAGELGELILRTPGRADHVLGDPELTDNIFRDGWWYSGDVVERREDGTFRIVGRDDDMIISGGINVFPSVVEDSLSKHPAVADVAVVGLPHEQWGQQVVAVVRPGPGKTIDATVLDTHCQDDTNVPRHARPREYFVWDDSEELPKTPTGKIFRAELVDRLEPGSGERPAD